MTTNDTPTPRTDALDHKEYDFNDMADLARSLERELAEARAENDELKASRTAFADSCRAELVGLRTENERLREALGCANKDFAVISRLADGTQAANTAYQAYQSSKAALNPTNPTK